MSGRRTEFAEVVLSLSDLTGAEYAESVCRARAALTGEDLARLRDLASEPVDFYPAAFHDRMTALLGRVGESVCEPLEASPLGATTAAFAAASHTEAAPLTGCGLYRVGEGGRLYLVTKSEHYHAAVGHAFPGYALLDRARALGIPNATHNNTRGHITRLLEEELVRTANGLPPFEEPAPPGDGGALDRVLNLETGSLAVEAALKMMLARFYRVQADGPGPMHGGRVPVFIVIGDEQGGLEANYHGTTVIAQILRGMWPDLGPLLDAQGILRCRAVPPNDLDALEEAFHEHPEGPERIAGFLHELVLMNYGAVRLDEGFVRRAYALCAERDIPTLCDEIQSCLWSPQLYLFREYDVRPTFVAVGKGFPGGEYPASRLLFDGRMDVLPQFGALVTNGQEELASLAYLITMRWAEANAEVTERIGDYFQERLHDLASGHRQVVRSIEGCRHMAAVHFHELDQAQAFSSALNRRGLDISVQSYKAACPPAALVKLPITAGFEAVDFVADAMAAALRGWG